jgi:hypothetical protein
MAYMSQEKKKAIAPKVKSILKKYGLKGSLSVDHHSTLVLNIKSGAIDFLRPYNEHGQREWEYKHPNWGPWKEATSLCINEYRIEDEFENNPIAKEALLALRDAMNDGNHDRSDIMTDYFDVGWYVSINIGKWNKPYELEV